MTNARRLLGIAIAHDRTGASGDALRIYPLAAAEAERACDVATLSDAWRRMAVLQHLRGDALTARRLIEQAWTVAVERSDEQLTAEALCTRAGFDLEAGRLDLACLGYAEAESLAAGCAELRARIEQNFGIVENIRNQLDAAENRYLGAVDAFERLGDARGRALVYHNLGVLHCDRARWEAAERCLRLAAHLAEVVGDLRLVGLCRLNQAEVHLGRRACDRALCSAEAALRIFEELGANLHIGEAYRMIGRVFRESGRHGLATSRLKLALETATATGAQLTATAVASDLAVHTGACA